MQVSGAGPQKIPTGEPNCPPYVYSANCIFYKIVQATDGSTGGSDVGNDLLGDEDGEDNDDFGENLVEMTWLLIQGWRTNNMTMCVLITRITRAL